MKEQLLYLWQRRLAGEATAEENARLDELLANETNEPAVQEAIAALYDSTDHTGEFFSVEQKEMMFSAIVARPRQMAPVHRVHFMRRWWWAAAVLLLVVYGWWFVVGRRGSEKPDVVQTRTANDIAPGRDGAVLTLADGKTIVLDSLGNGVVAQQNGSDVALRNGRLHYDAPHSPLTIDHSRLTYNMLSTPRGRQFQLVLPDGSKVWLNAASSITYPTVFAANERKVQVTGEVYFEVRKDTQHPFIVDVDGKETVEVLGTHFNINSYNDEEAIRTTLLEGSIRLTHNLSRPGGNAKRVMLKPGEQAIASAHSSLTIDHSPDLDQVMAWKNGSFSFSNTPLTKVMREIARWYDVEIRYEGPVPAMTFGGEIARTSNASEVLKILAESKVHFKIDGKTIIVSK